MASKAPKFIYTGIEVSDLDSSRKFYGAVLGMKELFVAPIRETGGRVAWFRSGGSDQHLELNWYPERSWVPGGSLDHLGFVVDDAAAWKARIERAGGKSAPDAAVEAENFKLVFCFDPDGVPLELIEPKAGRKPARPRFVYTGIRVTDLQAAAKWYAEVLGMKSEGEGSAEWTGGRTVGLISPGGKQRLELNWYPGSYAEAFRRGGSELDHLCFEVDDCDSWFAKLGAMGHKQLIAPFDEGSWRLAYVEGPDGECLEIGHRLRKPAKAGRRTQKSKPRGTRRAAGGSRTRRDGRSGPGERKTGRKRRT